nr:hypothetical protein [Tanacetum cinerariifolium]
MKSIQTSLEKINCIPFEEKPKILLQAWYTFFAIQHARPENSNELFQKLFEDLKELAEYDNSPSRDRPIFNDNEDHSVRNKEYLENSSNEIAASNFNQEKEKPPQDSDIRQLIREECCIEVCEEQKQKMEDTILELVEICHQKDLYCMHDNVDDLIESALNSKLLSINSNSQHFDKKEQEVKNVVEQPAERGTLNEIESNKEPVKDDSSAFTTFSNPLFNDNNDFTSNDDESLPDEDILIEEFKIYSNPFFDDDDINSDKLDPHCLNVKSDFVESLLNRDTFIDSSPKSDFLLKEFSGELAHINPEIKEADFDFEEEIRLIKNMLYDNSSPQSSKELNAEIADTIVETLPTSPIPLEDSDSQREEIVIVSNTDELLPPGFENDDAEEKIDVVQELRVDNSKNELSNNEASNFDNPSFPSPPPEPPDAEFDFEPDSREVISAVMKILMSLTKMNVSTQEERMMFLQKMKMSITLPSCLSFEFSYHISSILRIYPSLIEVFSVQSVLSCLEELYIL